MPVSRIHSQIIMMRTLDAVNRAMDRMQKTQLKIATGRNINSLSDNPVGVGLALNHKTNLSKNDYYKKSITMGLNTVNRISTALENAERLLSEIRILSDEAAASNITSAERAAISLEVNDLLSELIDTANTKGRGKFLFGGTETLSGTQTLAQPFNAQYSADGLTITGVVQNPRGINKGISLLVADSNSVDIKISGGAIFQPNGAKGANDVFDAVIALRDAVESNDVGTIQGAAQTLDQALDLIVNQETLFGAKARRLELTQDRIEKIDLDDTSDLSEIMDVDLAEAIMEFTAQQAAYQAALQAGSKSLQQSLLNFI